MTSYRYELLTWPEIREAVEKEKVVVLVLGSIEQHGPHLPVGTDSMLGYEVCRRAAERVPEDVLLLPPLYFGMSAHHMDFPGSIAISGETYIRFVADICRSLVHHGFKKILLVSGHGGNTQALGMVIRDMAASTDSIFAGMMYFSLIIDEIKELRESDVGGVGDHSAEAETSMMLHFKPELVKMELAKRDGILKPDLLDSVPHDVNKRIVAFFIEPFSKWTESGIIGDAAMGNAEKGEVWIETAAEKMAEFIRQFKARKIKHRVRH